MRALLISLMSWSYVIGSNENEHNIKVTYVLEVLKTNNVLLNDKKCIFNASKIEFLGHILTPEGVRPLDKYIKIIEQFRQPKTVEELQSFLGLVNFVEKWIPNLATLTDPLRHVLKFKLHKHAGISQYWNSEQSETFTNLKIALTKLNNCCVNHYPGQVT